MSNKYNETISKIEASEELKNLIIEKMEREQAKKSGGIIMKIKKVITIIMSLLGLMTCGGFVYAAVSGMLNINGILFSAKYVDYQETVKNQIVEKEGTKVELVSTICDDGFLVLQFEIDLNDNLAGTEDLGLVNVSFNEKLIEENGYKYFYLGGTNYNLIIDGEKHWVRGAVTSQLIENIKNKNYTLYQLYFLPAEAIENKETYTVTLDDIVLVLNPDDEEYLEMDGKFEIEVSKGKALQDTTTIENDNASVVYERLTHKVEKVSQTPMQTLIKLSSLTKDATLSNTTYLLDEDYIGNLEYEVYDQNDNELFTYVSISGYEFYYPDGTIQKFTTGDTEGAEKDGYNKILMEEYIVTEKKEDIKSLRIEVYEKNDYFETTRNIGTHFIDLENGIIISKNENKIMDTPYNDFWKAETSENNENDEKNEVTEILEELYYKARGVYFESAFKYNEEPELIKYSNIRGEEFEVMMNQIINYDEVLDKIFTDNGKKQYKKNIDCKETDGRLVYIDEKVYGNVFAYAEDEDYNKTEFINITEGTDEISCVARNIYYSEGRDAIEEKFVIKKVNGVWLVDEYSNNW